MKYGMLLPANHCMKRKKCYLKVMQKSESLLHDNFILQVCKEKVTQILSSGEISVILKLRA